MSHIEDENLFLSIIQNILFSYIYILFFIFIFYKFLGIHVTYNAVLVSGVQQSESAIYIYIYNHSFSDSFPI